MNRSKLLISAMGLALSSLGATGCDLLDLPIPGNGDGDGGLPMPGDTDGDGGLPMPGDTDPGDDGGDGPGAPCVEELDACYLDAEQTCAEDPETCEDALLQCDELAPSCGGEPPYPEDPCAEDIDACFYEADQICAEDPGACEEMFSLCDDIADSCWGEPQPPCAEDLDACFDEAELICAEDPDACEDILAQCDALDESCWGEPQHPCPEVPGEPGDPECLDEAFACFDQAEPECGEDPESCEDSFLACDALLEACA